MMACITSYFSDCFPTAWNDEREIDPATGKTKGHVTHTASGDIYGHGKTSDTDEIIRCKLAGLIFLHPFSRMIHLASRILYLLTGQWIVAGYQATLQEKNVKQLPMKGWEDILSVTQNSLFYLADALLKTTTLPFACALALGSCCIGLVHPLLGRRLFAKVEEAWSLTFLKPPETGIFLNFSAPCMQPNRIWREHNFYPLFKEKEKDESSPPV